MPDKVFLRSPDKRVTPLLSRPFANEVELDETIEHAPELLSAALSTEDRELQFLFIEKQASIDDEQGERTSRWSADLLFIDSEGMVTIVEDKLSRNPEIRRKVVGQAIEYAANIYGSWSAERVKTALEKQYEDASETIIAAFDLQDSEVEDYWARVGNNLRAGAIRLVFAADALPRELKLSIEFLNQVTHPLEIVGVEIKQMHDGNHGGMDVLVASAVGLSERKTKQRTGSTAYRTESTKGEFLDALKQFAPNHPHGAISVNLAERLFEHDDLLSTEFYVTPKRNMIRCKFHRATDNLCLLEISAILDREKCSIQTAPKRNKWSHNLQESFHSDLGETISGLGILNDWLGTDPTRVDKLFSWIINQANKTRRKDGESQ